MKRAEDPLFISYNAFIFVIICLTLHGVIKNNKTGMQEINLDMVIRSLLPEKKEETKHISTHCILFCFNYLGNVSLTGLYDVCCLNIRKYLLSLSQSLLIKAKLLWKRTLYCNSKTYRKTANLAFDFASIFNLCIWPHPLLPKT